MSDQAAPVLDCNGCGVCCLHMGYPAFVLSAGQLQDAETVSRDGMSPVARRDLDRWLEMPQVLRDEVLAAVHAYDPPASGDLDGPCVWLDPMSRLCKHHTHRPQVCRDFRVGGEGCLDWRHVYQVST